MGTLKEKASRSAAFWFGVAFALIALAVVIGAANNRLAISEIINQGKRDQVELRCRAESAVELELATAKMLDKFADVSARAAGATEMAKAELRKELAAVRAELVDAEQARSDAVEACKDP